MKSDENWYFMIHYWDNPSDLQGSSTIPLLRKWFWHGGGHGAGCFGSLRLGGTQAHGPESPGPVRLVGPVGSSAFSCFAEMGPILWATRFRKDRYGTNDLTNVNIFGVAQSWTWFSLREAAAPHLLPGFPTCEHLDPICNQVLGYWDDIQRIISISLSPTIVTNEWL